MKIYKSLKGKFYFSEDDIFFKNIRDDKSGVIEKKLQVHLINRVTLTKFQNKNSNIIELLKLGFDEK